MKNTKTQSGQMLLVAIIVLAVITVMLAALMGSTGAQIVSHRSAVNKEKASNIAEAGAEMALWKLNNQSGYSGESNTSFGAGTYTVSIATIDSSKKAVSVTAWVPNSTNPVAQKTVKVTASINASVISFRYGLQVGAGGFTMSGGSTLNGNIYSNGSINATTGVHITGSAIAANPPELVADQNNNSPFIVQPCNSTSNPCLTFANASATEDFAQSFRISQDVAINNIQFYIKKVGAPADATVTIVADNAGLPSSTVFLTGTLSASMVTTNFGWVTVLFPSTPILSHLQTYWMVINAASNSSKYYIIADNSAGYPNGVAKIGKSGGSWSNTTPAGLDVYFQLYLGGGTSTIGGSNNTTGVYIGTTSSDNAWAHTVQGATVTGTIYCQSSTFTNKACNTTQSDPNPQPFPLSDNNIQEWKDDAAAGGTITGDYHVNYAGASLGPKKITGNLLVDGGGTLTVTGTLWIQGTITVNSGGKVQLASSYGTNSGAIVSDGYVSLTGGVSFAGSGQAGSYPFLITTSTCPGAFGCGSIPAINLSGGAGTVALVAQNGNVTINGGSSLKQVTAKQVTMTGGATLYYDSGLISENFSSGPGGSWGFLSGSYSSQ